jgi:GNAT superfamily N-acetyltransferase
LQPRDAEVNGRLRQASAVAACGAADDRALGADDEPLLQRFFDENPAYFIAVHGEPDAAGEAHEEIHGLPPAGWSFSKKWLVGYVDGAGSLVAVANVITDLLAPGVWHIGLFIVATSRHGSGDAQRLHDGLERWASGYGARWLRLGVVRGNGRAERFWESLGYTQVRTREGVAISKLTNTLRVMIKPCTDKPSKSFWRWCRATDPNPRAWPEAPACRCRTIEA